MAMFSEIQRMASGSDHQQCACTPYDDKSRRKWVRPASATHACRTCPQQEAQPRFQSPTASASPHLPLRFSVCRFSGPASPSPPRERARSRACGRSRRTAVRHAAPPSPAQIRGDGSTQQTPPGPPASPARSPAQVRGSTRQAFRSPGTWIVLTAVMREKGTTCGVVAELVGAPSHRRRAPSNPHRTSGRNSHQALICPSRPVCKARRDKPGGDAIAPVTLRSEPTVRPEIQPIRGWLDDEHTNRERMQQCLSPRRQGIEAKPRT
ncbi:uncharacterized protein BJ171DRAFT_515782 [Polychytrium aggregatum]|uniref:uncharacterized protein n=1 Tax=Polychytrium aggregatum TaxID=110093 RepID=UPI0022FF266D|nr:uncharacterized protein BJ171DRAFT_515782 [Polychytrium aggregatum]KAI9202134.1 hypothetical protein BJ171DRAFT_515782 [Polychytrium aggregatum]